MVVALELTKAKNSVPVGDIFAEGETLLDHYSGERVVVKNHVVQIRGKRVAVLLAKAK